MLHTVTRSESKRITELQKALGERTFRQLLTPPEARGLVGRRRLRNLEAGTGKLSDQDRDVLKRVSRNRVRIETLKRHNKSKQEFRVNRALRDFVLHGKQKGAQDQTDEDFEKATRALVYLGVDLDRGEVYLRKES